MVYLPLESEAKKHELELPLVTQQIIVSYFDATFLKPNVRQAMNQVGPVTNPEEYTIWAEKFKELLEADEIIIPSEIMEQENPLLMNHLADLIKRLNNRYSYEKCIQIISGQDLTYTLLRRTAESKRLERM